MGAKTKQVGGGSAAPLADNWNNFLNQQLTGQALPAQNNPMGGWANGISNAIRQQQSNAAQPAQQSQTGFQNAFNQAMSGQVNDSSGAFGALQGLIADPSKNFANTNFANTFTGPQFQQANVSQLGTNFGQGQTGMANLSQFGNAAQANFDTQGPIGSQFTNQIGSLMGQGSGMMQGNGGFNAASIGQGVQLAPGMNYQDAYNTLGQDPLMERNRQRAAADMRARFGAEGAGALGTGAQFAESNLNAELAAQDASQRRQQAMALMGQDLNERMGGANVGLQSRGQDANVAISNMQGGLQGAQNRNNLFSQMMSGALGARGQDMQTQLGQLGLGSQQSMFNAGQRNDLQGQMINANLQNQQLGNQFGLGAAQLNNAAMQTNNANSLNSTQFQNQFNQNNAQLGAQFGLGANQLNSQNQQANNNFLANILSQGGQMNQLGNQNMMQMIQNMFGANQQANALGTPQAQIIQQPSGWGQALNAGLGIAGMALGGPIGGMIGSQIGGMFGGGGGGSAQLPVGIGGGPAPQSIGNFQFQGMPNFQLPQLFGRP